MDKRTNFRKKTKQNKWGQLSPHFAIRELPDIKQLSQL